jgi:hypothetical protein
MAKKIKKISEDLPKDEELLADPILVNEDLLHPEEKPKKFLGYHPITGAEVWQ